MKFNLSKENKDYLLSLIDNNHLNMSISEIFSYALGNKEITNPKEVDLIKEKFSMSEKDIYFQKLFEYLEIDEFDDEEVTNKYIYSVYDIISQDEFINNPYYQLIKIENIKEGDYELVKDHYEAYELFPLNDMKIEEDSYIEINSFGLFKKRFNFLSLNYRNVTWMNITPNEIKTMEKSINAAKADVVIYGLGLGYFAFMVSRKENVKNITIIEKDKSIIDLFKKHILPLFPNKNKIQIVEMDAYKYMKENHHHDYAFVDLWHDPMDGIDLYLKAKRLEKIKTDYWLESSFYAFMRRCMLTLIEEQLEGLDDSNYLKANSITDQLINKYYQKTKNLVLSSKKDIQDLLSNSTLLSLLL